MRYGKTRRPQFLTTDVFQILRSWYPDGSHYRLTRFWIQRTLGLIYLIAFLIAANQYIPLAGEHGLLPARLFLKQVHFGDAPSVFFLNWSDAFITIIIWCGLVLSVIAFAGISDAFGMTISVMVWALLWLLYLSLVNVGQVFYGFGWEMLLLETGFLAIFFGPTKSKPPTVIFWLVLWILFRTMFGAGMIKLRGDECWRDLTCLFYHHETQPLPNPLSWYLHHLPQSALKMGVLFNHFVELIVPWFFFAPRRLRCVAGGFTILFQVVLILSGNLSWLNYITIVLCIACFDDKSLSRLTPKFLMHPPHLNPLPQRGEEETAAGPAGFGSIGQRPSRETTSDIPSPLAGEGRARGVAVFHRLGNCLRIPIEDAYPKTLSLPHATAVSVLTLLVLLLSIQPALNLFSRQQLMNASFNPLHLVNTYGAFGSVTKQRYEIIIEGTDSEKPDENAVWKEYEFKGKPGDLHRRPCLVSPYHWKLDWQMWFAAMSPYQYHPWILNLVAKLLEGDTKVLSLMAKNPFPDTPPKFIRAELYLYHFTDSREDGAWWRRQHVGNYLPPLSLSDPEFRRVLKEQGWLDVN
jgi:hypothetical protein